MNIRSAFPPLAPIVVAVTAVSVAAVLTWSSLQKPARQGSLEATFVADAQVLPLTDSGADQENLVRTIEVRPLFAQGRRNPDPVTPLIAVAPAELPVAIIVAEPVIAEDPVAPALRVVGSMSSGAVAQILVRKAADNSERWLKIGDEIEGWALVEITQDTIYLRRGEAKVAIKIFE